MERLRQGFVIVLRKDLNVYDPQNKVIKILDKDTTVLIENVRSVQEGSEDDGLVPGVVADARVLKDSGEYDAAMPLYTFAQTGAYRPEFCQLTYTLLRKMRKTFIPWD